MHPACAADEFLDPEVAFKLSASPKDNKTVELLFQIAPGYYLYREQFRFEANGAQLGAPVLPAGKTKFDETFQKTVETYRDTVRIEVPVQQAGGRFELQVTNQGCADQGLCYPPMQRTLAVSLSGFGGDGSVQSLPSGQTDTRVGAGVTGGATTAATPRFSTAAPATATAPSNVFKPSSALDSASPTGDDARLDGVLRGGRFWPVVSVFLIAGVLLSLTPCVLPMLPILSSIVVGHGTKVSRGRGLALAASYSFGMALVYTALGVAAGLAGEGLAATLQSPWVLGLFAAGLVALAASMFGVYELQLPAALSGHLSAASQRMPTGRFASVFVMGGLSALIVSPCVAAPLAGALVYLSQTRNVWLGGTALFSLAAGMSVPLLLVGASAGALLPRAGPWMEEVKRVFGLLLLGVALWTVQSVLPAPLALAGWGVLAIGAAVLIVSPPLGATAASNANPGGISRSVVRRTGGAVLLACGLLELAGAAAGSADPLQPLARWRGEEPAALAVGSMRTPTFRTIASVAQLDAAVRDAKRPVMLDFYADWCVSCKEMERFTFSDPAVQQALRGALLLKADVTANSADDRALLKRFQLFGPPGTIFFNAAGQELSQARLIGFQDSAQFLKTLRGVGL